MVAEGFFDYITPGKMDGIIDELKIFFKAKILLISTVFVLDERSPFRHWIFRTGVSMVGEKIRLNLSQKDYNTLLNKKGFSANKIMPSDLMKNNLPDSEKTPLAVLDGFCLLNYKFSK